MPAFRASETTPNPLAGRRGWYVVQVKTGQEMRMCSLIEHACSEHDSAERDPGRRIQLAECFSPTFITQKKWKGDWVQVERPLLPGYVVADATNPVALSLLLKRVQGLCRMLSTEETFIPLDEHERSWLGSQTMQGNRVVPMSFGSKVGDTLVVTEGPLAGNEAMITKFDRASSLAEIELHVGPMTIRTTVGLAVIPHEKTRRKAR